MCTFIDSAKEQHLEAVSENLVRKSKKRKKQSVDIKPSTDDVKNKKKRKVILGHCAVSLGLFSLV